MGLDRVSPSSVLCWVFFFCVFFSCLTCTLHCLKCDYEFLGLGIKMCNSSSFHLLKSKDFLLGTFNIFDNFMLLIITIKKKLLTCS